MTHNPFDEFAKSLVVDRQAHFGHEVRHAPPVDRGRALCAQGAGGAPQSALLATEENAETLARWFARAVTANNADEVFGER